MAAPEGLIDLLPRLDEPPVRALLALSMFPDPERLERAVRRYRETPGARLYGLERAGLVLGLVGLEPGEGGEATIRHIAVAEPARGHGLGRAMLEAVVALGWHRLVAQTDAEAAGFYRRCGFRVTSLGEPYPGVERLRCELEPAG